MDIVAAVFLSALTLGGAPSGELLDFSATWCGPCQQMAPLVDRLARQGYPVRKIDIDQNKELARQYGIQSIPAFVLVVNGKVVKRATGIQSEAGLMQMLAQIPKAAPEFDSSPSSPSSPPLLVDSRGSLTREQVTMIASQPSLTSISSPPKVEASKAKPQNVPNRGLLGLNLLGRNSKPETPAKKLPAVIRANLDDQPLPNVAQLTQDPLAASTRIRISDKEGINLGSGTIVECKVGQALILTCGHIFRNIQPDSVIEVDVILNGKTETFVGKPVQYDLEVDLGVIAIPTDNSLPFAAISATGSKPVKGSAVESVGCGQGNNPTLQKHLVTHVNRYNGPENIECTGVPIQGRSGGGLFNMNGQLVGVCMAADTKDRRGLYMGLGAVQGFLKKCQLERLLPDFESEATPPQLESDPEAMLVDAEVTPSPTKGLAALQEALDQDDAEVVCLVRSDRSSQARQRVVVLSAKTSIGKTARAKRFSE